MQAAKLVVEKEMFNAIDSIKEITRSVRTCRQRANHVGGDTAAWASRTVELGLGGRCRG